MKQDPKILTRLNRIEGQVRGISRMLEEERYCIDVVTQVRAVRAALLQVEREVLKAHADGCITEAVTSGSAREQKQKFSELVTLLIGESK